MPEVTAAAAAEFALVDGVVDRITEEGFRR